MVNVIIIFGENSIQTEILSVEIQLSKSTYLIHVERKIHFTKTITFAVQVLSWHCPCLGSAWSQSHTKISRDQHLFQGFKVVI